MSQITVAPRSTLSRVPRNRHNDDILPRWLVTEIVANVTAYVRHVVPATLSEVTTHVRDTVSGLRMTPAAKEEIKQAFHRVKNQAPAIQASEPLLAAFRAAKVQAA